MIKTVKILKNLPSAIAKIRQRVCKYKTHRIFKAFETFAYLKALTTSGKLHNLYGNTDAFMQSLSKQCQISRNSMYTRIEWMKDFNLVKMDNYGSITLESWDTIAKTYQVKKGEFQDIELSKEGPKLEFILRTLTIAEHKKRMEFSFAKKINSNNQLRHYLESFTGIRTAELKTMADMIQKAKIFSFRTWSESFDFWHSIPSDFNASVKKLMQYFSFDDFRQVAYWKRKLAKMGLITIQTRKYESKLCTRKANDVLYGGKVNQTMFWDGKTQTRVWQMPDAITINF